MNREFERLNRLYSAGIIKPQDYFNGVYREYSNNADTFSLDQVDLFEKQTKEVGLEWKPDISSEEGKIAGVLNQFASGMAEGFTTFGWADDPTNTVEGLSNKIGHLVGFAPDIVAGVLSFGASVPISAVKRATQKAGLTKAAKTWNSWLEKGAEQVPLLTSKNHMTGQIGLRSVPLKVADFVIDNAAKRLGDAKLIQTSFLTKGLARNENFKAVARESAHLGVALAVSARKEGPEGWAEAAQHGALAGAFFGGLGRYVYLGRLLSSGNKGMVVKAQKEIRNTADDLAEAMESLRMEQWKLKNRSPKQDKISRSDTWSGKKDPRQLDDPLYFLDETETILKNKKPGSIKQAPEFHGSISAEYGMMTEGQAALATFLLKGGLGSAFTGGMATMQRAPLPDQVYEYLLGFFFGAASRPRGEHDARVWLMTKGYPELMKQAANQYPMKPEVRNGRLEYRDRGFVDFDYRKIEGYEKLDSAAKDYLERWNGNRMVDMLNKGALPQALARRTLQIMQDPRYAEEKAKRGELKFLQDAINSEVERWRRETADEVALNVAEIMGKIENTDLRDVKVADYISVFDMFGRPTDVEIISRKDNKIVVRDPETGNTSVLDAKDSPYGTVNYANENHVLKFNPNQKQFDPYRDKKLYDLSVKEIRELKDVIELSFREVEFLDTRTTRLLNALEIRANQLEPKATVDAKHKNQETLEVEGKVDKKDTEQVHDIFENNQSKEIEQEIDSLFESLGSGHKAKEAIRNIARLDANDSKERFWKAVTYYAKRNKQEFSNPSEAISSTRDPKNPLNDFTIEYINKDGITKKRDISPRTVLQNVYFKERAMSERKSYIVKVSGGYTKDKKWNISWDLIESENYLGNSLTIDTTQSYMNNRMKNKWKDPSGSGEFERIISHEFVIQGEYSNKAAEQKVYQLNNLSEAQSLYAINLMLSRQAPEQGGPRYISGFNPSNGEIITIPYAQDVYKLDWIKPEDTIAISNILSKPGEIELAPKELLDLKNNKINVTDPKTQKPTSEAEARQMYEKMRLSNFIYAAELAGYVKPENIRSVEDIQNAMKKYQDKPLFKNVAKATKYIKTLYNGVPLSAEYYGNTTFLDGKGNRRVFQNILNEEGGFNGVILTDHKIKIRDVNGKETDFDLTDGTKYYRERLRRRMLLETGRINPDTPSTEWDAYIKDVILVPENVDKNRGLLINKGAEDSATKAIYELMEANNWDVMMYESGRKSESRHEVGEIVYNEATGKWSVKTNPEVFTIKPEDVRIIPHEVEIKRDGSAPIHWGLINKISNRMSDKALKAFNGLFENVQKGDETYIRKLTSLVEKDAYNGFIEKAELDVDRLSMPFIYKMLSQHTHSRLTKDILKNLFKSQNINEMESIFGRESAQDIQSLNQWLEQIDYNPYGLVFGNKAAMFNEALNNILINKFSRPVVKRGFTSLRLKGYDPEIEAMVKKINGEGIRRDEFYLYNGDKSRDIEYRDRDGKIVVDTLFNVYKKWKKARDKFKKTLEEDMMYVITRSPQADEAGIATLKFGGFIDKPGRGIVVHKRNAERLGGADYDGDMVAGYQSIDLAIKKEFMKPEFSEMHQNKDGDLKPLKNPAHDEKFGIKYAEESVYDVWDPSQRYRAGYQAIQGQKDIGLDVNATGRFRRIFDSIYEKNKLGEDLQISIIGKKGTHFLRFNPEIAKKGMSVEEVWDIIRDERTTKQNNAFDALDYIEMKPSQQVSGESFFRYFQIIDAKGNPIKPLTDATPTDYLNSILPVNKNGEIDYGPIFNPNKKVIEWKREKAFKVKTGERIDQEGFVKREGPERIGIETIKKALELNPEQVFQRIKFREMINGKLQRTTQEDVVINKLGNQYLEIEYTYLGDRKTKRIPFNRIDGLSYQHNYFRALEVLAAADASFNGNKNQESRNETLYGSERTHRMDVIEDAMAEMNQYFIADSAQGKIANNLRAMKDEVGSLKFELDVFKYHDLNNIFKNISNAYLNMQDTPLFKYLVKEQFINKDSDPFMVAARRKDLNEMERAGLILKAITLDAEINGKSSEMYSSLASKKLHKDILIANHIRRAEMLVSASEMSKQLELRLGEQGVPQKEIHRLIGQMVSDIFVGKHILQARYFSIRKQQEGKPYVDKFLASQHKKFRNITLESGQLVPLDKPTQEVLKYFLHKMMLSEIVPGEKSQKYFDKIMEKEPGLVRKYELEVDEAGVSQLKKQYGKTKKDILTERKLEIDPKTKKPKEPPVEKLSTYDWFIKDIEKRLSEGISDVGLDIALLEIITPGFLKGKDTSTIVRLYQRTKNRNAESANLWNSQHIPSAHKQQMIKEITDFITAADKHKSGVNEYMTKVFDVPVDKAKLSLVETLKKLKEAKRNNEAKKVVEEAVQTDLVNALSELSRKKEYKRNKEIEEQERKAEKEFIEKADKELKEDIELQTKDQDIFNEFSEKMQKEINKEAYKNNVIEYGSGDFLQQIHSIYKEYGRPTAMAIAKRAIREYYDKQDKLDLFSLKKSRPLEMVEDIYDPLKPTITTPEMLKEFAKLEKAIEKNPDLLITIEGLMTELSANIGWTGVQNVAIPLKNNELDHLKAFNRFIEDMYIAKGSLLDKVKNKIKKYGKSDIDAETFRKNIDEDKSVPKDVKSVYHLLFNEFVAGKLRTHEMELYEKKNVPVFDKNGNPVITTRTLTLPTSTLEMVRLMVDQGKTLNTALSGFAEQHLKESFDFINAGDNFLLNNFRDIFKAAVAIREADPVRDKSSLHFGELMFGNLTLDKQSKEYLRKEYEKANDYLDSIRMKENEIWPDAPGNAGMRKFTIQDPANPGKKKTVTIDEFVDSLNNRITDFYGLFKDKFIMKNFRQNDAGNFEIRKSVSEEVMGKDGFIDVDKVSAKLDLTTRYSGANINRMLDSSVGLNELLYYQYEYGLRKAVQQELSERLNIKPKEVDLSSKEAQELRDDLTRGKKPPMVNIVVDALGNPTAYWSHNGHSRYQANRAQLELYIQERLAKYGAELDSESAILSQNNLHSKLYKAAQLLMDSPKRSKVLAPYMTWEGAKAEMLKDRRRTLERGIVSGQREDGGYSEGIAHMIQSKDAKGVFSYLNGSMKPKDELIMPGYDKSYEALTTYHKNFLKTYIDNVVGFRSHLLIDKFEAAEKLGEHTASWSGYMRDALTNMLGLSTFRSLEIAGMKKKELGLLQEYIKADLDRSVFRGRLKYEEKKFLDEIDAMTSPDTWWITKEAKRLKDPEMLDDAIMGYRKERMKEFAKEENVNKIKRYGTLYNVFSDEVVVNTIRKVEKSAGKLLGIEDFTFFKKTKGLSEDSKRMMLANQAKALRNFEGKWELLSLLSHPKT